MRVKITLLEDMLGTKAANEEVFATYIASKAPDGDKRKEEIETAEHREEAGTTVFHRHPKTGNLMLWDYQIKGFLKEAGNILRQCAEEAPEGEEKKKGKTKKWGTIKTKMDNFVMVTPRMIDLGVREPARIIERPLRAETMMGPRVSLARSEVVSAGTSFEVNIDVMPGGPVTEAMILECLEYGKWKGLGQWRNASWGRFSFEVLPE